MLAFETPSYVKIPIHVTLLGMSMDIVWSHRMEANNYLNRNACVQYFQVVNFVYIPALWGNSNFQASLWITPL